MHAKSAEMLLHFASVLQRAPLPGQLRPYTHLLPRKAAQSALLEHPGPSSGLLRSVQKPLPSTVSKHSHKLLLWHFIGGLVHVSAQWQFPFSSGMPPFLWHLRCAFRVRASACLGITGKRAVLRAAAPNSCSARLLEIVPSSSPLARSSKNCSPIVLFPCFVVVGTAYSDSRYGARRCEPPSPHGLVKNAPYGGCALRGSGIKLLL
jgi:hypothetical protein